MHYLFIQMPSGVSELRIRSSEGTGHANLYANLTSWATPSSYHYRSINAGNSKSITIPNPPSGWLYISLHAESSFSGVQVSTEY